MALNGEAMHTGQANLGIYPIHAWEDVGQGHIRELWAGLWDGLCHTRGVLGTKKDS